MIEPFTAEEKLVIEAAKAHFWYFLDHVFVRSFDGLTYPDDAGVYHPFSFGALHHEWALMAQYNPRICVIAPRNHLKTTVMAQGFAFWQMFRVHSGQSLDVLYISYKSQLAAEKCEDLLKMIERNTFCRFWKNLKPAASTQVNFRVDFGDGVQGDVDMITSGILAATRGRHPRVTICDDILSDFANPLTMPELEKISRIFHQVIMSLPPNPTDPLVVVGTPQSYEDVLHLLAGSEDWVWLNYPAIIDEKNKITQWPEKYSFERLKRIQRQIGGTAFEVEYQLAPVRVSDQFFTREDVLRVVDEGVLNWPLDRPFEKGDLATYAGFDVGRKVHPSHVAVLLELESGTLVQVFSAFLDQMPYPEQVRLLNQIASTFKLSRGYFDATYNALEDRGLSPVWRGRAFSRKLKADMATLFEKRLFAMAGEPTIILQNDLRQIRQITQVDKRLTAATTVEGHGDAFWSLGLAIRAAEDGPGIRNISAPTPLSVMGNAQRAGQTWVRQLGGGVSTWSR